MGDSECWIENLKDDPRTSCHVRELESSQSPPGLYQKDAEVNLKRFSIR